VTAAFFLPFVCQPTEFFLAIALLTANTLVSAQITFYENESFMGRTFLTDGSVDNFARNGFNDQIGM